MRSRLLGRTSGCVDGRVAFDSVPVRPGRVGGHPFDGLRKIAGLDGAFGLRDGNDRPWRAGNRIGGFQRRARNARYHRSMLSNCSRQAKRRRQECQKPMDKRMMNPYAKQKGFQQESPEPPLLTGNCQQRLNQRINHVVITWCAMPEKRKTALSLIWRNAACHSYAWPLATQYTARDTAPVRNT